VRQFLSAVRFIAGFLLAGAIFIGALFYILVNYSAVTKEFSCEGETRFTDAHTEADKGRLQISEYRWWVSLWSDNTDGDAIFASTKFAYFWEGRLALSGDGSFSLYTGMSRGQTFIFRRATGELGVQQAGMTFTGECSPAS